MLWYLWLIYTSSSNILVLFFYFFFSFFLYYIDCFLAFLICVWCFPFLAGILAWCCFPVFLPVTFLIAGVMGLISISGLFLPGLACDDVQVLFLIGGVGVNFGVWPLGFYWIDCFLVFLICVWCLAFLAGIFDLVLFSVFPGNFLIIIVFSILFWLLFDRSCLSNYYAFLILLVY